MLTTVTKAAERLDVSKSTIRAAIRSGAIPIIRLGRLVKIDLAVLDALERVGHPTLTKRV
jgi:excisionase family DNA binding protein